MTPLKRKRVALGMTVETLAKKVGASPSAVSYWENGERQPSPRFYVKYSKALHISGDELAQLVIETTASHEAVAASAAD